MAIGALGAQNEINHIWRKRITKLSVFGEYGKFTAVGLHHLQIRLKVLSSEIDPAEIRLIR